MSFTHINIGSLLAPTPVVMISCSDRDKNFNIITIAWVGVVNSKPPMLSISVTPERYSYGMLMDTKEFVVNFVSEELVKFADFCGVKSGREINKFKACGLTSIEVEELKYAPAIDETPIFMACSVREIIQLPSHTALSCGCTLGFLVKQPGWILKGKTCILSAWRILCHSGKAWLSATLMHQKKCKRRMGKC